jgi:cell division transport system ATP-binding protein
MISLSHVSSKRYPAATKRCATSALRSRAGELTFITRPSGAGKSTLLKLLVAIDARLPAPFWLTARTSAR